MDMVKENLPVSTDDVNISGIMSTKLHTQSQTPRQPLVDLKQVARPVSMDVLNKPAAHSKAHTPLHCTPKVKKINRKFQPSALVYKKEEVTADIKDQSPGDRQPFNEQCSIPEEDLDDFVSQVIGTCVQDLQTECQVEKSNTDSTNRENAENVQVDTETSAEETLNSELGDPTKINTCNTEDIGQRNESSRDEPDTVTNQTSSESLALWLNEDSLLGDTSNYSGCNESLTESTETEDELLASCCNTPEVSEQSPTESLQKSGGGSGFNGFSYVETHEPTPRPTFLEKVALTQRVQDATASVANWVVPHDQTTLHLLRQTEVGKAKLVHDVACSPFLVQEVKIVNSKSVDRACSPIDGSIENESKVVSVSNASEQIQLQSHPNDSLVQEPHDHFDGKEDTTTTVNKKETLETKIQTNSSPNLEKNAVDLGAKCDSESDLGESVSLSSSIVSLSNTCSSHSVQCSPITFASKETIQHNVQNQSSMTSPLAMPVVDVSTQHEIETQSVICSPIPVSTCNISIQHEPEMVSVMSSPMVVPVCDTSMQYESETQSVMCSPVRFPVLDMSIQNVAETHSAVCSPMVPCPSHDKSVLMTGPELVDIGTSTEEVMSQDATVTAAPETQTVATEMDDSPMTNTATSMTPVKLNNKQGRKLTADDVRKQHPRVLANQLDTLMVENVRLESLVKNMEKQHRKLVAQEELMKELDEARSSFSDSKERYDKDLTDWQDRCDKLESEMVAIRIEHQNEILKLKEEYETTDYRDHYLASQELVKELQNDLEQFNKLVDDIDESQTLQTELGECLSFSWDKIKMAGNKMFCLKQKLDEQVRELAIQKAEKNEQLQFFEELRTGLENDRQEMTEMVTLCKENMIELETNLENTTHELQVAQDRVTVLETELSAEKQGKEAIETTNTTLTSEVEQLKKVEESLSDEIKDLQAKLSQTQEELAVVNKSLKEVLESKEKEAAEYKTAEKKSNQVVINLERTLEMREHDIDSLERDLFECREIIYTQLESIKAMEIKDKTNMADLQSLKSDNISLRDCCAVLRGKEQELKAILESVQEELAGTKDHATRIIKKQGTEITECFSTLAELTEGMKTVLSNLNKRAGIQKVGLNTSLGSAIDELSQLNSSHVSVPSNTVKGNQNSLVSQILNAAKSMNTGGEPDSSDSQTVSSETLPSSTEKEQNKSNFSAQTSDEKVDGTSQSISSIQENESKNGNKSNRDKLNITAEAREKKNSVKMNEKGQFDVDDTNENCLMPQVKTVSEMFNEIMRVAHLLEKALKSSLSDVRAENDDLNCRMFQCDYTERRLAAELELKQSELTKSKKSIKQLQDSIDEMGERFGRSLDHQAEVKQQQLEIRNLRGKVHSLEGEKDLLTEQITELLQQVEALATGTNNSETSVASKKEILKLQHKVERYRAEQIKNDNRIEELSSKAARRIQKLEDNWRKADAEVCRLDELVDIVHRELTSSESFHRDRKLQKLVHLIAGEETPSNFKDQTGELKPVKTAKW